jgi:DNA-binding MarR family transcriptional regulator
MRLVLPLISRYNYLMHQDNRSSREKARLDLLNQMADLSRSSQSATDLFDERVSEFLGINRTDGRCLDIIGRHKKISAGQLSIEAGLTTGAVTAVIDRLEASGYVQRVRDPVDRRKIWVECTPHTYELTEIIFGVYDIIGPVMMNRFTDEQLVGIVAFLKIGTRVNEELAEGLRENTKPGAARSDRVAQARLFRRAMDAGAGRLSEELERLAPPVHESSKKPARSK